MHSIFCFHKNMAKDLYSILEVSRNASPDEIKQAYRRLALKYHPDKNPGDKVAEEKFKEINAAYEILADPKKKQMYDQMGEAAFTGGYPPPGYTNGGVGDFMDFSDIFGDIFDIFGGGPSRSGRASAQRGADIRTEVELTLKDAATGVDRHIETIRNEPCHSCHGSGAKAGTQPKTCPTCRGQGQVRTSQGFFSFVRTCSKCHGKGTIIENPCPDCKGRGVTRKRHTMTVKIPPGVADGTTLKVAGGGDISPTGYAGDLYVVVYIKKDSNFTRHGDDLLYEVYLHYHDLVLGTEIKVPTIEGHTKIKVPSGTHPGTILKVKEYGMPRLNRRGRGDLLVKVNVKIPSNLSERQKIYLKQFANSLENN